MKRIVIFLLIIFSCQLLFAQEKAIEYKPFKFNVTLGQTNGRVRGGLATPFDNKFFYLEAQYAINKYFSFGAQLGGAFSYAGTSFLTCNYYFLNNHILRYYFGAGLGNFNYESAPVQINRFGGMLRTGVEIGHFRTGIEYNNSFPFHDPDSHSGAYGINKYWGFTFGFSIGGGLKKTSPSTAL